MRLGWAALAIVLSLTHFSPAASSAESPVSAAPREEAAKPQSAADVGKNESLINKSGDEICRKMYEIGALRVHRELLSFTPVFGKPSIRWTDEDYGNLLAQARACHGFSDGEGDPLQFSNWMSAINDVRNRVLPVNPKAEVILSRIAKVKVDKINKPSCESMIGFKINAYDGWDSSGDLFGISFLAMSLSDLEKTIAISNLCLGYLPDYAQALGGWQREAVREAIYRVMDRALIIQKRRLEWEALPRYDTDLVLDREGVVIPTTFTSPDAREMINRFNKSTALRRPFSPEAIGVLLRMAEDVLRDDRSTFDKMYASAVKTRCQQEIFRK